MRSYPAPDPKSLGLMLSPSEDPPMTAFLERMHKGKVTYGTKAAAKKAAAWTTTTLGGRRKTAYRCWVCHLFHVGTDKRSPVRAA